jgi:hypothetical protein
MTKGRLDKKQRLADQRRERAQAATGLAHGAKKPMRAVKVPTAAKRPSMGRATAISEPLPAHSYPVKRVAFGKRQAPA